MKTKVISRGYVKDGLEMAQYKNGKIINVGYCPVSSEVEMLVSMVTFPLVFEVEYDSRFGNALKNPKFIKFHNDEVNRCVLE
jgi:hypothetical protein